MVQGAKPSKRPSHRSWSAEMARAGVRAAGALRTSLADLQYEHDALRQEYDAARAEASSAKKRLAEERHRIRDCELEVGRLQTLVADIRRSCGAYVEQQREVRACAQKAQRSLAALRRQHRIPASDASLQDVVRSIRQIADPDDDDDADERWDAFEAASDVVASDAPCALGAQHPLQEDVLERRPPSNLEAYLPQMSSDAVTQTDEVPGQADHPAQWGPPGAVPVPPVLMMTEWTQTDGDGGQPAPASVIAELESELRRERERSHRWREQVLSAARDDVAGGRDPIPTMPSAPLFAPTVVDYDSALGREYGEMDRLHARLTDILSSYPEYSC